MAEPRSVKEYWSDPKHDRRKAAGRRDADYSVCVHHADCERIDDEEKAHICAKMKEYNKGHDTDLATLKAEHDRDIELITGPSGSISKVHGRIDDMQKAMVGKWAFGIMVTVFLAMFAIFGSVNVHLFNSIKADLKQHVETVKK